VQVRTPYFAQNLRALPVVAIFRFRIWRSPCSPVCAPQDLKFLEQSLGVLQVGGVEALGEPVVDLGEHRPRFLTAIGVSQQSRETDRRDNWRGLGKLRPRFGRLLCSTRIHGTVAIFIARTCLGVTRCRSRSLSGANRARNPERPRSLKKRSAAARLAYAMRTASKAITLSSE
jgi:hypothetical protein